MSKNTLGLRERQARKRHRRARVWCSSMGAGVDPLRIGRKHFPRWSRLMDRQAVAESEKRTNGAPGIN